MIKMVNEPKKLYRSRNNRFIAGVCGGLGEFFNIDPTLIRLLFVLGVILSWGMVVVLYLVLMFVVPEETSGYIDSGIQTASKVTSEGEAVPTGAGGRSQQPPPEPSAQDDIIHGPVGTPGEEVYREPREPNPPPPPPQEPRP
jgi:phage shock protein C